MRARHRDRLTELAETEIEQIDDAGSDTVRGSAVPRIFTPPLRELTPETSYGFDLIDFAEAIGMPLDPWQQWVAIHMGELLPDGRPRFRMVLVLVARQNGKTTLCRVLTLYWLHVHQAPLIIGTSASRDTAKESWRAVIDMALGNDALRNEYGTKAVRETIGEEAFSTLGCGRGCQLDHEHRRASTYRFAAPNRRAGRSKTVHRAILDELREHQSFDVYNALIKAMTAVRDAQAVAITNQGDTNSVVLDSLRTSALDFIETGRGDPRLFLAEWSAPNGAEPTDPQAIALANPDLGNRIHLDSIIGDALRAKAAGGEELAGYKTETLCQRVTLLDPAIDPDAWQRCGVDPATALDLAQHRRAVALCLDVALDGAHATLVAAATIDGVTHVEVVRRWQGFGCTRALRGELPDLVARIKPRVIGWFPAGPAAAVAADLKKRRGARPWPPRPVKVEEIVGEASAVCMGLAEQVLAGEIRHPRDEMLNAHVEHTQKLIRGETWTFTRSGTQPVDATYATAGAVHLARTLPPPLKPLAPLEPPF